MVGLYGLDTSELLLKTCVSQICYESGAKHINSKGDILLSSGNAIAITQLVPTTGYFYLRNIITDEELNDMMTIGVTDPDFVKKYPRYKSSPEQRRETIKWLSNEVNNIVLWGYIMRHNLNKSGYTLNDALLAYNQGNGYLNKYINNGKATSNHIYVKTINRLVSKSN